MDDPKPVMTLITTNRLAKLMDNPTMQIKETDRIRDPALFEKRYLKKKLKNNFQELFVVINLLPEGLERIAKKGKMHKLINICIVQNTFNSGSIQTFSFNHHPSIQIMRRGP